LVSIILSNHPPFAAPPRYPTELFTTMPSPCHTRHHQYVTLRNITIPLPHSTHQNFTRPNHYVTIPNVTLPLHSLTLHYQNQTGPHITLHHQHITILYHSQTAPNHASLYRYSTSLYQTRTPLNPTVPSRHTALPNITTTEPILTMPTPHPTTHCRYSTPPYHVLLYITVTVLYSTLLYHHSPSPTSSNRPYPPLPRHCPKPTYRP
jgi:hypothetical protein